MVVSNVIGSGILINPAFIAATVPDEEKRLARGKTYEPRTITERTNWVPA